MVRLLWLKGSGLIVPFMRAFVGLRGAGVAHCTFIDGAGVALQQDRLKIVVRLNRRIDGVLAAMAGLAVDSAMPGGKAVQFTRIFTMGRPVARAAAGFAQPWLAGWVSHIAHIAVTALAGHTFLVHNVTQALGLRAGVTLIAIIGHTFMLIVHGQRQAGDSCHPRRAQSIGAMAASAQNRTFSHQGGTFLLIVQGQNVLLEFAGGNSRIGAAVVVVAILAVHLGRNRGYRLG